MVTFPNCKKTYFFPNSGEKKSQKYNEFILNLLVYTLHFQNEVEYTYYNVDYANILTYL